MDIRHIFLFLIGSYLFCGLSLYFNTIDMHERAHASIYSGLMGCDVRIEYFVFQHGFIFGGKTIPTNCSYDDYGMVYAARVLNAENEIVTYNLQSLYYLLLIMGLFIMVTLFFLFPRTSTRSLYTYYDNK